MRKAIQSAVIWALRFAALFLALTASYLIELAPNHVATIAGALLLAVAIALLINQRREP